VSYCGFWCGAFVVIVIPGSVGNQAWSHDWMAIAGLKKVGRTAHAYA
jgi:hypothetical protein